MRILVIGATGVVGRQLLPMLVGAGHEVTATTTTVSKRAGWLRPGRSRWSWTSGRSGDRIGTDRRAT
jgi:nucleoside-diphosphate-sugar epimerase